MGRVTTSERSYNSSVASCLFIFDNTTDLFIPESQDEKNPNNIRDYFVFIYLLREYIRTGTKILVMLNTPPDLFRANDGEILK